jgi:hypothetical protein
MKRTHLTLLVFLVACGGGGGGDDAATPDSGPDADLGEAGEVTVEVHPTCCLWDFPTPSNDDLIGGVDIVVRDADGTISTVTSINGQPTIVTLHAGASVTAIYDSEVDVELVTYAGVVPGDTLEFGGMLFTPDGTPDQGMTVTYPALTAGTYYDVVYACGNESTNSGTELGIFHFPGCTPTGPEDVFLYAQNAAGLQYGALSDIAWSDGGTLTLDAWQPAVTFDLDATGIPDGYVQATLALYTVANGTAKWHLGPPPIDVTDGAASMSRSWAPVGDATNASIEMYGPAGNLLVRAHLPADATTHTFTTDDWLPKLDGTFAVATREITITGPRDPRLDAVVVYATYDRTDGQFLYPRRWTIIAPPDTTTLALPDLPAEYDDVEPHAEDTNAGASVTQFDFDTDDGYDDARRRPPFDFGGNFEENFLLDGGRMMGNGLTWE